MSAHQATSQQHVTKVTVSAEYHHGISDPKAVEALSHDPQYQQEVVTTLQSIAKEHAVKHGLPPQVEIKNVQIHSFDHS